MKRIAGSEGDSTGQARAFHQHIPMVLIVDVVNSALVPIVLTSYLRETLWLAFLMLAIAVTGARAIGWDREQTRLPDALPKMGDVSHPRFGAVRIALGRRQPAVGDWSWYPADCTIPARLDAGVSRPNQLALAILNLAPNGRDPMPDGGRCISPSRSDTNSAQRCFPKLSGPALINSRNEPSGCPLVDRVAGKSLRQDNFLVLDAAKLEHEL